MLVFVLKLMCLLIGRTIKFVVSCGLLVMSSKIYKLDLFFTAIQYNFNGIRMLVR